MYSHCPLKGNLNLVILLSLGIENLGLWGICETAESSQLLQQSHGLGLPEKNHESRAGSSTLAPTGA